MWITEMLSKNFGKGPNSEGWLRVGNGRVGSFAVTIYLEFTSPHSLFISPRAPSTITPTFSSTYHVISASSCTVHHRTNFSINQREVPSIVPSRQSSPSSHPSIFLLLTSLPYRLFLCDWLVLGVDPSVIPWGLLLTRFHEVSRVGNKRLGGSMGNENPFQAWSFEKGVVKCDTSRCIAVIE